MIQTITNSPASKKEHPGRTIETMFRVTSTNSQRLSDQADTKSNILISVNAIIVSVLLGMHRTQLSAPTWHTVPVMLFMLVNVVTIIFAVLATRPNVPAGRFSGTDVKARSVNLLFFGNFYKMNFSHYSHAMLQVMNDRQFLDQSLLKDIYCQGVVLGRKYWFLKLAYAVFLWGLISVIIAYIFFAFIPV